MGSVTEADKKDFDIKQLFLNNVQNNVATVQAEDLTQN